MSYDDDTGREAVAAEGETLDWVLRMAEPDADWDAFTVWLEGDPARAERYDRVSSALRDAEDALREPAESPSGLSDGRLAAPFVSTPPAVARVRSRKPWIGGALAAALVGSIGFGLWTERSQPYAVETAAGRQGSVRLADGSRILLAGGSRVRLDREDPRLAAVERGEALFQVRHDPRHPFKVRAGDLALTDLGTVFDVRMSTRRTRVEVSEGTVMADLNGVTLRLDAGQGALVQGGAIAPVRFDADEVAGWRKGRLAFDDADLAEVAEDLSRTLAVDVRAAPSVARRRFHGTIEVQDLRDDADLLGKLLGVEVRRSAGGWTLEPPR